MNFMPHNRRSSAAYVHSIPSLVLQCLLERYIYINSLLYPRAEKGTEYGNMERYSGSSLLRIAIKARELYWEGGKWESDTLSRVKTDWLARSVNEREWEMAPGYITGAEQKAKRY